LLLIGGILWITLPLLYDQLSLLIKMLVEVFNNVNNKFHWNIGSFEIEITEYLNEILKNVGAVTSSTTMGLIGNLFGFFGQFIVGFVGFIYFLVDMDKIRSGVKELLLGISKRSFNFIQCMDEEITNYLKGLEIFMVIQLFEYSILFLLIGHPNWLILGILACLTTIIPYFGGLITNIIAIILASVVSLPLVIATIVICLIFPQLDGYVISPKVYGKTNNINPLITIMAVSIGGTLAGIWGIVVALPVYLFLRCTYHFFKKDIIKGVKVVKETI
jgi:predicted PurR-regulated permease PerM